MNYLKDFYTENNYIECTELRLDDISIYYDVSFYNKGIITLDKLINVNAKIKFFNEGNVCLYNIERSDYEIIFNNRDDIFLENINNLDNLSYDKLINLNNKINLGDNGYLNEKDLIKYFRKFKLNKILDEK